MKQVPIYFGSLDALVCRVELGQISETTAECFLCFIFYKQNRMGKEDQQIIIIHFLHIFLYSDLNNYGGTDELLAG